VNQVKAQNLETSRAARREMSRHKVDCSEVEVSVSHGVIHLHGRVRPLRGHEAEFDTAVVALVKGLRERHGIRDVIAEWKKG